MNKPLLWKTYWLYLGTEPIQSVLLPVGATEYQVKQAARDALEVIPAIAYPSAPYEWRSKIQWATVVEDDHSFERTTPEKYWGFIPNREPPSQPTTPLDPVTEFDRRCREIEPPECIEGHLQPLSPWTEARVRAEMARDRCIIRRAQVLAEMKTEENRMRLDDRRYNPLGCAI